jgi:hypothetical protein
LCSLRATVATVTLVVSCSVRFNDSMKRLCLFICLLLLVISVNAQTWTDTTTVIVYKGYTVKKSELLKEETAMQMFDMLKKHIDRFPDYVNDRMVAFFKTIPILLSSQDETPLEQGSGSPGTFGNGKLRIYPRIINFPPTKPVLLHEYMHAYHFIRLRSQNNELERYLAMVRASGIYKPGEYMLKNRQEFFAMTATTLLTGSIAREPFTFEKMKKDMPDYTAYLSKIFSNNLGL